jgi:hypothetical protein
VPSADPNVKLVFAKIRYVWKEDRRVVMDALPRQDPTYMGPETAVSRRMWISLFVRVLVMHTMYRDKENWAAFQGERATYGENVLHPFWRPIPSMREKSMVSHPNPDAAGDPP